MFVKRLSDAVNRPFVTIYTAFTLSKKDRNAIVATVSKYLDKEINYEVVIKPELIGGIQVQGFGFLFDNSVATRLNEIKEGLK
jgi:F0F1-type ATP synthase delta subunit